MLLVPEVAKFDSFLFSACSPSDSETYARKDKRRMPLSLLLLRGKVNGFRPRRPSFSRCSPPPNRVITHLRQRRIPRVPRLLVRIVPSRVVATDQRPPRLIRRVHIATVQEVAIEKNRVARFAFDVHQLHPLHSDVHALHICPCLVACLAVIDPAHLL